MNFQLMGLLTVIVGMGILAAPVKWSFTIMILCTVFGSAAAFSLPGLGGASVLVPSLFLLFFTIRLFMAYGEGPIFAALAPPRAGFWLLVLTTFGLMTSVFYPRFFQGMTQTMIVERSVGARSFISAVPLKFSSNNITQSVYAVGGLMCFATSFAFFRRLGRPSHLINGMLVVSIVNLSFALADIITYFTHTEFLLGFVRTANYALLTNAEKGGLKRISGTFPEASAFADFTLVLFAMTASLWLGGVRTRLTGAVAGLLLLSLLLSTSATALVGLAAILPVICLQSFMASRQEPGAGRPVVIVAILASIPLVVLFILVAMPELASGLTEFLNEMVFSKADSQSGRERFMWNAMAYQTFLDTYGFGAGLGSARASSFSLVLLSNVGVIGAAIFAVFVVLTMASSTRHLEAPGAAPVVRAAKAGFLAVLVTAFTSGTVYDLGLMFYILGGSIAALTLPYAVRAAGAASRQAIRVRPLNISRRLS